MFLQFRGLINEISRRRYRKMFSRRSQSQTVYFLFDRSGTFWLYLLLMVAAAAFGINQQLVFAMILAVIAPCITVTSYMTQYSLFLRDYIQE